MSALANPMEQFVHIDEITIILIVKESGENEDGKKTRV